MPTGRCSRRELLTVTGALAAGAATAPTAAAAGAPSDTALLTEVLASEQLVVFAYAHIIGSGLLDAGSSVAATILPYEHAHVRRLEAMVGPRVQPPATVAQADKQLEARHSSGTIGQLRTGDDALRLLYDVESIAIGAYYKAIGKLRDPAALRTAAETMAAEAQHAAVIGELLHPGDFNKDVPNSLVEGKH